jgi:hypothetical protein
LEDLDGVRAYGVCSRALVLIPATARDALVGFEGCHVLEVDERAEAGGRWLRVVVESPARGEGGRSCGVVTHIHGRRMDRLPDELLGI